MKISDVYPTKYVTAADLQGKDVTLTILKVTLDDMQSHDNKTVTKPVCWFERATKGFVMNVTNATTIAKLYGDETDNWPGQRITIYPTRVKAFGSMQDCIRVRPHVPAKPMSQPSTPVEEPSGIDDDEDVTDGTYEDGDVLFTPGNE